jgi:hypothetical protein
MAVATTTTLPRARVKWHRPKPTPICVDRSMRVLRTPKRKNETRPRIGLGLD